MRFGSDIARRYSVAWIDIGLPSERQYCQDDGIAIQATSVRTTALRGRRLGRRTHRGISILVDKLKENTRVEDRKCMAMVSLGMEHVGTETIGCTDKTARRKCACFSANDFRGEKETSFIDYSSDEMEIVDSRNQHFFLYSINKLTKWVVTATAMILGILKRDELTFWCIIGSVFSVMICKAFKYILNEARPLGAPKLDPGMPSSHANSLSFLSSYIATVTLNQSSKLLDQLLLGIGIPVVALFLAWLRLALGYHTLRQVAAGWMLGTFSGILWALIGARAVIPLIETYPFLYSILLVIAATLGIGLVTYFITKSLLNKKSLPNKSI